MNFQEYIIRYYKVIKFIELKQSTISSYLSYINNIPKFWTLETITTDKIQILLNELSIKLSNSSLKHIYQIITQPLLYAINVEHNNIDVDISLIKTPKIQVTKCCCLPNQVINNELKVLHNFKYYTLIKVLIYTGMRIGEALALTSKDINLLSNTININKSLYDGIITSPKTVDGIRTIPIHQEIKGDIIELIKLNTEYLFPFTYQTVYNALQRELKNKHLQLHGFHIYRHTFATAMLENDVDLKTISSILGHKNIQITAQIYTEITDKRKQSSIIKLNYGEDLVHTTRLVAM